MKNLFEAVRIQFNAYINMYKIYWINYVVDCPAFHKQK